ncbi:methyltransferase [Nitzschia inconspicua]|uniref:Methyltransferase n=1 Tax=Nitzschia inconspicua TaxID=303405 RepID=A0A9K3PR96_9STRA|nr:methyltransferase [Nitzschia inconspicua]
MQSRIRRQIILALVFVVHQVWSLSVSSKSLEVFRKSNLLSWKDKIVLGHCVEERNGDGMAVKVWLDSEEQEDLVLSFPEEGMQGDGLASQLWPMSLASSILLRSSEFQTWISGKRFVELGSGRGLTGLVAAARAQSALLTDNDADALAWLQSSTCPTNQGKLASTVSIRQLDWRDDHYDSIPTVDLVLGSDIAYYFHLIRPLMDTIRAFMDNQKSPSSLMVIGQANRESQWDLYRNIRDGCYNQLTDLWEPPWQGTCQMLLYRLQMSDWCPTVEECSERIDGTIPVSLILYNNVGDSASEDTPLPLPPFQMHAHIATEEDDVNIMKSF